ncbi:hypothetical protein CFP56_043470 [Quercus suber]|uniref:Uncharacterized protein n=1 Tax=Quercus suber TaxID=58331 RepID=A0AAW0LI94_QUESU
MRCIHMDLLYVQENVAGQVWLSLFS